MEDSSNSSPSRLAGKLIGWATHQGGWFFAFVFLATAVFGGGIGVYFSNLPSVLGRIQELQEELEGVSELSLPDILLHSAPEVELVSWGVEMPSIVRMQMEEREGRTDINDYIVSVSTEQEGNDFTLEIKVQDGNTLSPRNIKEYDFICNGNITDSDDKVGSCTSWAISEVEEQSTFEAIQNSQAKIAILENCQKDWRIIQVERSTRYERGIKKGDTAYEVVCVVKDDNFWSGIEVVYDEDGDVRVTRIDEE